jgi:hypothetical protein
MNRARIRIGLTFAFAVLCFIPPALAQQKCPAPPPFKSVPTANIFTPQQEVDLGDIQAERVERSVQVIHDDELAARMNRVVDRILAQMPPTQLQFRVALIDAPIVNSFSLPGGRIYVARKMVAFLRNDDELAGMLGHEMGHALSHQGAIEMTRLFHDVLGVTSVGDRKDIHEKWNRLLDNAAHNPKAFEKVGSWEEPEQYQADQVALYAMANAGYAPQSWFDFFDRLAQTKGRTGDWLSDFFSSTTPNEKRLREIRKSIDDLPPACKGTVAAAPSEEFQHWQADVIGYSGLGRTESLIGVLDKKVLDPPLRSDIEHFKFSPDGKYILAQDDASIFVLSRDPLRLLFRMDAPDSHAAQFSPDSQYVVFDTRGMRVEKWSISDQSRVSAQEVAIPDGCIQTHLAPDGKTLACLNSNFDISLLDVSRGTAVLNKKAFFAPSSRYSFEEYIRMLVWRLEGSSQFDWAEMQFSPDARYFLAATLSAHLAFDLTTNNPVALHGAFGDMLKGQFAFLSPDRVIAVNMSDTKNSAVLQFPSGEVVERLILGDQELEAPGHGNYAILRPVKNAPAGLLDLSSQEFPVIAKKSAALDAYDDEFLGEKASGEVALFGVRSLSLKAQAALSLSPLGRLRALAVSSDLKWVALSGNTRGAVWNLSTGKRLYYTRGFQGAYFEGDTTLFAEFPKLERQARSIARMDLAGGGLKQGIAIDDKSAARQWGRFLVLRKPTKDGEFQSRDMTVEVSDMRDGHLLWSRRFPKGAPAMAFGSRTGTAILDWQADDAGLKEEVKSSSAVQARYAAIHGRKSAHLLEVLDSATGKELGSIVVDTGDGSFRVNEAYAVGDWVVIADSTGRTRVYSLSTGELKGTVFGTRSIISPAAGLLGVENEQGRLDIYNLPALEKRGQLDFSSPISMEAFSDDGKQLLVLTKNQTAYTFDPSRIVGNGGTTQVSTNSTH